MNCCWEDLRGTAWFAEDDGGTKQQYRHVYRDRYYCEFLDGLLAFADLCLDNGARPRLRFAGTEARNVRRPHAE